MTAWRFTGSALQRVEACPPSGGLLPQASWTNEESIKGTSNHSEVEEVLLAEGGTSPRLPRVVRETVGTSSFKAEVTFALHIETGRARELGVSLGRDYSGLLPGELALTIDLICFRSETVGAVWDWKTRKRVPPPRNNLQILAAAYCASQVYGWDDVEVGIGYLSDNQSDMDMFDPMDLMGALTRIQRLADRARNATGETFSQGPWCEYCPSMPFCPAMRGTALAMVEDLEAMDRSESGWTDDQAGAAWRKLQQAKALTKRVEDALRTRARRAGLPLPDGKRLMVVESSRAGFDKVKALRVLAEHGHASEDFETRTQYTQLKEVK